MAATDVYKTPPGYSQIVSDERVNQLWDGIIQARGQHDDSLNTLLPVTWVGNTAIAAVTIHKDDEDTEKYDYFDNEHHLADNEDFHLRYRVGPVLGRGGSAKVHRGKQKSLQRRVAVKIAHQQSSISQRSQFSRESQTNAALEHPNIVPVYDAGDGYMVMKEVSGKSLAEIIAENEDLDGVISNIDILVKVCDAINYAHSRGVIHRDLKAANVMVGRYGEVLVVDWGLAISINADERGQWIALPRAQANLKAGTPGCMPPEVARGHDHAISYGTDVYLLGTILYHILHKQMPFSSDAPMDSIMMAASNHYDATNANSQLPQRLVDLQNAAMATDPAQRPTVADWSQDLRHWLQNSGLERQALQAVKRGAEFHAKAKKLGRKEWDLAYHAYNASVAAFEQAIGLMPDLAVAETGRHDALHDFCQAAVQSGNIFLARMLFQGQRPPMLQRPEETSNLLDSIKGGTDTTQD